MKDENARQVVLLHSQGEGGYVKAVEALINNYGSPTIVFPHHVRRTIVRETVNFSKDGFTKSLPSSIPGYEGDEIGHSFPVSCSQG